MNSVKERDNTIDIIKGFAICVVVVGHAIETIFSEGRMDQLLMFRIISSFQMPLFMYTSGYVYGAYGRKYDLNWICRRFVGLIIPFWTWGILLWALREYTVDEVTLFERMRILIHNPSDNGLWFLTAVFWNCFIIFVAHLFSLAIEHCFWKSKSEKRIAFIQAIVVVFLTMIFMILGYMGLFVMRYRLSCQYNFYFALAFLLGTITKKCESKVKIDKRILLILVMLSSVLYCLGMIFWRRNMVVSDLPILLQGSLDEVYLLGFVMAIPLLAICTIFYVFYLLKRHMPNSVKRGLLVLGNNTLAIYAMHWLFLNIHAGGRFVSLIISALTAIVMPLFLSKFLIEKSRILRLVLLGNR